MAYTTINKSTEHFNTKLYTGNGSTNAITGVGHSPDFVWCKLRNALGNHRLANIISGTEKRLFSNSTNAEATETGFVTSFDSDGFTHNSSDTAWNGNGSPYVSWNWKANGSGSANTDGSITSTVSANTTSGFSIVKWVGTGTGTPTVGHGLGVAPKMIIVKTLDGASTSWVCYNEALGPNEVFWLNSTGASSTVSGYWGTPDSTTFGTLGAYDNNISGDNYIAYCFADVQGYSKFGSYTGNGNADGTFVYTGFKPAFVMVKSTGSGGWLINDVKRSPHNITGLTLYADSSASEESYTIGASEWDFLSNGFKNRDAGSAQNTSGTSYMYMAFAEAPLVGTNGVTAKAR